MDKKAEHIAVIMDGNGRWAQALGLPRSAGHKAGSEIIEEVCKAAIELDIKCLTLFGLSCDNLNRPSEELAYLLNLTCDCIEQYLPSLCKKGVKLEFIGDIEALGSNVYSRMKMAMEATAHCNKLQLIIAMNFSGTWHVCNTAKQLIESGKSLTESEIKKAFQALLPSSPDILIRTGGEKRLSDFLMYHLAYTELFFLDVMWPDFEKKHFIEVIESFYQRDRRFGLVEVV